MPFLKLTHVSKRFKEATAVDDFNLEIEPGEFVSFLGPSGCGKTTTLRMIAGFEFPTAGEIELKGRDLTHTPANQRNIGMVFQSYALFPNLTIAENIGFGLKVKKTPAETIRSRVDEMLELIHLPGYGERYPYQLSGGQQQRIALARALAIRPQVLLLDEPLSALDAKIRVELRSEIRRIQQQLGITTIYVTHDQEEALSLSDRVVVMNRGQIEQVGTPFEIYNYPRTAFTASFIGQLNLIPVVAGQSAGTVRLADHDLRVEQVLPALPGAAFWLAVRPEELRLGPGEDAPGRPLNHLPGQVESVTFLGAIVRIKVNVGSTALAVDTFNERKLTLPAAGEQVVLNFPVDGCWPMER